MSDGITYCSAFPKDTVFGAIINSFQFRWTGSCVANPEYEHEDMLKAVLHTLVSSEINETPFLVVLILPISEDTPWNSASIRCHSNMSTLTHSRTGHMRFAPVHRQSDSMAAILPPAKWPVELVLTSDGVGREKYLDQSRINGIITHAIMPYAT